MYCDTDSIFYIDNGQNTVKTGDLLGEWTDELGENVHIEKWLAVVGMYHSWLTGDPCQNHSPVKFLSKSLSCEISVKIIHL